MTELEAIKLRLRELAGKATPGPWLAPHFGDTDTTCECRSIVDEGYAGGIATIHVGNGLPVGGCGGNDAPPPEEAAANGRYIAAVDPTTILALLDENSAARDEALEKAAQVVDGFYLGPQVAAAIRRLKSASPKGAG